MDLDNDAEDLVVTHINEPSALLRCNRIEQPLAADPACYVQSERDAIGAKITVRFAEQELINGSLPAMVTCAVTFLPALA